MSAEERLRTNFETLPNLIRAHATERPNHPALIEGEKTLSYAALAALMDRIAFALQRDGVRNGDAAAICAPTSMQYGAAFCGILAAGAVVAPLAPSSTAASLMMMLKDSGAKVFFLDRETAEALEGVRPRRDRQARRARRQRRGRSRSRDWLGPNGANPPRSSIAPDQAFNIIYSSGTTGAPKGIVQPHRMRWGQFRRASFLRRTR